MKLFREAIVWARGILGCYTRGRSLYGELRWELGAAPYNLDIYNDGLSIQ
jgi:hypothetical protein